MTVIPAGWTMKPVGAVCSLINGHGFSQREWSKVGLPIIRIQNLNGSCDFNHFDGETKDAWIVEKGDLLFAWAGVRGVSFGPSIWRGPRGVLNQHIYKIVPQRGIVKHWLLQALRHVTPVIERRAHGFKSNFVHVQRSDIADQALYVPPVKVQRGIGFIASLLVDQVRKINKQIDCVRHRKLGLAEDLLSGRRRFPEYENETWFDGQIGDVMEPVERSVEWADTEIYRLASVRRWGGGLFDRDELLGSKIKVKSLFQIRKDDILLSNIQAAYGAIARVTAKFDGAHVSSTYTVLIPKKGRIDPVFAGYLFNTRSTWHQAYLASNGFFAERLRLCFNQADFLRRPISIPENVVEQRMIARLLSKADCEISLLEKLRDATERQNRGLLQRLLTGEMQIPDSLIDKLNAKANIEESTPANGRPT